MTAVTQPHIQPPDSIDLTQLAGMDPSCLAKMVEDLRSAFLFGDLGDLCWHPMAEQHFLIALDLLSQAQRHLTIANYNQMQGR